MRHTLLLSLVFSSLSIVLAGCADATDDVGTSTNALTEPPYCPAIAVDCLPGTQPTDHDGDGCIDGCGPVACPEIFPVCDPGTKPADLDGDGCIDGCGPIAP